MTQDDVIGIFITRIKKLGFSFKEKTITVGTAWQYRADILEKDLNDCRLYNKSIKCTETEEAIQHLKYSELKTLLPQVLQKIEDEPTQKTEEEIKQNLLISTLQNTHSIYIDVNSGRYFLWLNTEHRLSEWDTQAYFKLLGKERTSQMLEVDPPAPAKLVFEPFKGLHRSWTAVDEGMQLTHLNTYTPPIWLSLIHI